ncbi:MAG: GTP 3',8-cyclase MoaA [Candidatus Aenigmarchaeota archaeon]|nr:GTP 3',8-cyclase MoaA [Candidatus Aenigmarchaeota archaeon]
MALDKFGRNVDYLRISITNKCNMKCGYCHEEGNVSEKEVSKDEIVNAVRVAAKYGVTRVKITGGEPLLRRDITGIIKGIASVPGIGEVSMTTNGSLLKSHAKALKDAGLSRVNIGCDSIGENMEKNTSVTKEAIDAAKEAGLGPIKINMVVVKGVNDHEIPEMIGFARENGVTLQLIELIETPGNSEYYKRHHTPLNSWEQRLSEIGSSEKRSMQSRMQYSFKGSKVEIVRADKEGFCRACNTIRLSSDGKLKPCLRLPVFVDFNGEKSFEEAMEKRVIYNEGIN